MIYLDTSVALAALFAEGHRPPARIWREPLVASRLLEYEMMVRLHARGAGADAVAAARALLDGVALVELVPAVLGRALQPFPTPVRTLDAMHLATMDFLRSQSQTIVLATYDQRLAAAAAALGFPLVPD
jgi:predicted nucleic acid-binding protein